MPGQIFTNGPQAVPLTYTVPGTGEVVPLACQALFDGTGASGPFVPALIFKSQAGHVIARVPTATTVAAGASAEVSWFPGGEPVGASGGTTVAWGFTFGPGSPQIISGNAANGNPTLLDWGTLGFVDDGSGLFSLNPIDSTMILCSVSPQPGYFSVTAEFRHDNSIASALVFDDVRVGFQILANAGFGAFLTNTGTLLSSNNGDKTTPNTEFLWDVSGWAASRGDVTPIGFQVLVENFNAGGANLNAVCDSFSCSLVAA